VKGNESSVLAWHQTRAGAQRLREMVGNSPVARLAGLVSSAEELERKAMSLKPDILLLELSQGPNGASDLLKRLNRTLPRSALMVLAESRDPEHILSAMRLGVREYLTEPLPPQAFNDAVLRLARHTQTVGQPLGRIISFMGVKGGVGTTSLAASLAWGFSRQVDKQVALVDLDLGAGDLAFMLDMRPQRDLIDVAAHFEQMDKAFMESLLCEVSPGLRLLAAPQDPVSAEEIALNHVERALDYLVDLYSLVLLDLPSRLDEICLMVLERSEAVFLVLEPTVVCLKAARRLLNLAERLVKQTDRIKLIVNRDGAKGCLPAAEVRRALGHEVLAFLPNDSATLMEAANAGRPALGERPRAKWSRALARLLETLPASQGAEK